MPIKLTDRDFIKPLNVSDISIWYLHTTACYEKQQQKKKLESRMHFINNSGI